jgi:ribosomal protein L37AE/L43A
LESGIVVVIIAFIVRAVRLTNAAVTAASQDLHLSNPDAARSLVDRTREREVPCPRCGNDTSLRLGPENRYKCDTCDLDFEGPAAFRVRLFTDAPARVAMRRPGPQR